MSKIPIGITCLYCGIHFDFVLSIDQLKGEDLDPATKMLLDTETCKSCWEKELESKNKN